MQPETINYAGWPRCLRFTDGDTELVVTTDVGPRIIRFARVGKPNVLKEYADEVGLTGGGEWRIYGGHRLWHAPEVKPRTYAPENEPVAHTWSGGTLTLTPAPEQANGIQKEMGITPLGQGTFKISHRLTNLGAWSIELAPWALSVMAPGGRGIFPQESYRSHAECLLPARPLVFWHYTNLADPRWLIGPRFLQLRQDPAATHPQKIGFLNTRGWAAYSLGDQLFIKRFAYRADATYPDYGCNTETFTNGDMLEVESVGPLTQLAPGASVEHDELWSLHGLSVGSGEDEIEKKVVPLVG